MERITIKTLRILCDRLNQKTGSPMVPWLRVDGRNVAQIGCYMIDRAYGGYQLARIMNEGGGQTSPLGLGFTSARELSGKMHAYLRGMDDAWERDPDRKALQAIVKLMDGSQPKDYSGAPIVGALPGDSQ